MPRTESGEILDPRPRRRRTTTPDCSTSSPLRGAVEPGRRRSGPAPRVRRSRRGAGRPGGGDPASAAVGAGRLHQHRQQGGGLRPGGLSLNVLLGYTGQVSLGHGAFFGVGAFGGRLRAHQDAARRAGAAVVLAAAHRCGGRPAAGRHRPAFHAASTSRWSRSPTASSPRRRCSTSARSPAAAPASRAAAVAVPTDVRFAYFCIGMLCSCYGVRLAAHRLTGGPRHRRPSATTSGWRRRGASTSPATRSWPS